MIYRIRAIGRVFYVEGPERADFQSYAVAKFEAFQEARRLKREHEAALAAYAYVSANPRQSFSALSVFDFIERHLAPDGYRRVEVESVCLTRQDEYDDDDYGYDD